MSKNIKTHGKQGRPVRGATDPHLPGRRERPFQLPSRLKDRGDERWTSQNLLRFGTGVAASTAVALTTADIVNIKSFIIADRIFGLRRVAWSCDHVRRVQCKRMNDLFLNHEFLKNLFFFFLNSCVSSSLFVASLRFGAVLKVIERA